MANLVVCALGGISRSWELIGGPEIGLSEVITGVRRHTQEGRDPSD